MDRIIFPSKNTKDKTHLDYGVVLYVLYVDWFMYFCLPVVQKKNSPEIPEFLLTFWCPEFFLFESWFDVILVSLYIMVVKLYQGISFKFFSPWQPMTEKVLPNK